MNSSQATISILITFGGLFLIGLLADLLGRHTPLPRVTLLLLSGFIIGPSMLDWLPAFTEHWFPVLTDIALAMIGFLLGHKMTRSRLGELGRSVIALSLGEVLATSIVVFAALSLAGVSIEVALLLAGIAPASAPAATVDVVHESNARGKFSDTLLGIVAIDDAWGLLIFSLLLAIAQAIGGDQNGIMGILGAGAWEVGGAILLGVLLGLPMAALSGRVRPGEPTQAEALGLILLTAGFAEWLQVSYILSAMVLGATVANFAKHHDRPFNAIQGIEWPFLILFFLFAGAALHVDALTQAGGLAIGYIVLRATGLITGSYIGGYLAGTPAPIRRWIGLALLPQAGVAIGMVLLAGQRFPSVNDLVLPVVLGTTVVFEVIGPIVTRWTLTQAGDIQHQSAGRTGPGHE